MKKKAFRMFMALILILSLVCATALTAGATDIEPAVYHADVEETTEIPSVRFTGVAAPTLGKTVEDWRDAIQANIHNGTFRINGKPFQASAYENIYTYGVELLNSNKEFLAGTTTITAGTYYFSMYLFPASGYVFAEDVSVSVEGAADVSAQGDASQMTVYAKFVVAEKTDGKTISKMEVEGIPLPKLGETAGQWYENAFNSYESLKINKEAYKSSSQGSRYGNVIGGAHELYNGDKKLFSTYSSKELTEGVYYIVQYYGPGTGYSFADDLKITAENLKVADIVPDEDGWIRVWYQYELKDPNATEPPTEPPTEAPTEPATEVPTEPATQAPTVADPTQAPTTADPGQTPGDPAIPTVGAIDQPAPMPWWAIVLIALAAAALGVLVAVLILKKKK